MSERVKYEAEPDFYETLLAVLLFTAIEFVATVGVQSYLVGALLPIIVFPSLIICVAVAVIGVLIAALGRGGGGGRPPFWPLLGLTVLIIATIFVAFSYSHGNRSGALAIAAGVASALAWGLSVVGMLIWSHRVFSSSYWNGWCNLFAAVFAALAVGYT
jgi:hypothetical protein